MFDYENDKMCIPNTLQKLKEELYVTFVEDNFDKMWINVPL